MGAQVARIQKEAKEVTVTFDRIQKQTPGTVVLLAAESDDFSKPAIDTPYIQKADFAKLFGTDAKAILDRVPTDKKLGPVTLPQAIELTLRLV